jgi:hypothetical protein
VKEKKNSSTNIAMKVCNSHAQTSHPRVPNCALIGGRGVCPTLISKGGVKEEADMFIVKVSWDARNQHFRLADQKMAHVFEDGDMYLLVVDFLPQEPDADEQFIDLDQAEMGHA